MQGSKRASLGYRISLSDNHFLPPLSSFPFTFIPSRLDSGSTSSKRSRRHVGATSVSLSFPSLSSSSHTLRLAYALAGPLVLSLGAFYPAVITLSADFYRHSNATFSVLNGTDPRLKAVCSAQGYLQRRAFSIDSPVDVFSFMGLDPDAPPFKGPQVTTAKWIQEAKMATHDQANRMLGDLNAFVRSRREKDDYFYHADQITDFEVEFRDAVIASAYLVGNASFRIFYVDHVLPALRRMTKLPGPRKCLWPRVRAVHNAMCINTWPNVGMQDLLWKAEKHAPAAQAEF